MELRVDKAQRFAKMRAHTATHLLHMEIAKIISNTQQAGSHVDQDYLRFDFQTEKLLDNQELSQIEKAVNQHIYEAQEVKIEESSFDQAKEKGAKAFFEDKYGDIVRVVSIHKDGESKGHSVELCGGTHVDNTSKIGAFAIIGQEAVASGIKRIIAVTGPKVYEELENIKSEYENQATKLGITRKQFPDKLDKNLKDFEDLQNKLKTLTEQIIVSNIKNIYEQSGGNENFEKIIKIGKVLSGVKLGEIVALAKILGDKSLCIFNEEGGFAILSNTGEAKNIAQGHTLRGGGSDTIRQGKDIKIIDLTKEDKKLQIDDTPAILSSIVGSLGKDLFTIHDTEILNSFEMPDDITHNT